MKKLRKLKSSYYTQNVDNLPIEERVFFTQGLVYNSEDFRKATEEEIAEWNEYKKSLESEFNPSN